MNHPRQLVLGIGSGRCGTLSLAQLLDKQANARVTHERRPLLPWHGDDQESLVSERLARLCNAEAAIVGDVASFYLPYVERFISQVPDVRVVCLKRDREAVVESFSQWSDHAHSTPTDHWSAEPKVGLFHDPVWSTIFPKYDVASREEGIGRYWDEYYSRAEDLARKFPGNVRIFDMEASLNSKAGQRELLRFVGVPESEQVIEVGLHTHRAAGEGVGSLIRIASSQLETYSPEKDFRPPPEPQTCVILVPTGGQIVPGCENSLRVLEERGYVVRRVHGYSQIDVARNEMASKAILDGFLETIWVDADVGFHPDAIEKLREHNVPVVCGVYAKKGKRELAISALPGTKQLVFGHRGGLSEIQYAATGFLLVRRQVYLDIQFKLGLPLCNEQFDVNLVPYFMPFVRRLRDGQWYLGEDYAFCERARMAGYKIMADTTIRLWHIGNYPYGWEDAGREVERFSDYTFHFTD